jgi:hypothetical protein
MKGTIKLRKQMVFKVTDEKTKEVFFVDLFNKEVVKS